mmetsp:Transcript_19341/g.57474  ORF Transcript_19341/g.57474 Transcript_19341/m.57474 type:complete len:242 (+) Transcript_19341:199-924(+)|eukprot:CAMPEP_0119280250 /NCGR_PEP_ID=MMETSP1329-20130426/22331_1 /TAXON_ID=114041 /ORGANISM="Genus nov. species nov., Strain RCC1024" /LENGTH=241 /DNA_ID=CAMNT_0007280831 /DNA_START=120 /DNA_END=845 /DNA_ORIENTATION=-
MAELEEIMNATAADVRMDMGLGDQGDAEETNAPRHNPAWARLLAAWEGEKACPELLKWRGDLVDGLLDALEQQERMVAETVRGGADVDECLFSAPLYQTELARVKYVLTDYCRVRLGKLEAQAGHVAADPEAMANLSDRERAHLDGYLKILHKHHKKALLSDLPDAFADKTEGEQPTEALAKAATLEPPTGDFVFVRAEADLGDVQIDASGETATFVKGDVHVLRYAPVKPLVQSGELALF